MINNQKGFTLVELSIVLVVIGLIVAGVIGGQVLVNQAKLRSVSKDMERFRSAMYNFKTQYNAFPGDLSNANSYWPSLQSGDGDGIIDFCTGGCTNDTNEGLLFWRHLKQAGITNIDVQDTGGSSLGTLDLSIPRSEISNGGFVVLHTRNWADNTATTHINLPQQHVIIVANPDDPSVTAAIQPSPLSYQWPVLGPVLSSQAAASVDRKSDDGLPQSGSFRASPEISAAADTCVNDSSNAYVPNANETIECYVASPL